MSIKLGTVPEYGGIRRVREKKKKKSQKRAALINGGPKWAP